MVQGSYLESKHICCDARQLSPNQQVNQIILSSSRDLSHFPDTAQKLDCSFLFCSFLFFSLSALLHFFPASHLNVGLACVYITHYDITFLPYWYCITQTQKPGFPPMFFSISGCFPCAAHVLVISPVHVQGFFRKLLRILLYFFHKELLPKSTLHFIVT